MTKRLRILLVILVSLVLLAVIAFYILGSISRSGEANGLAEGKLTPCPGSPNCICSEFPSDTNHSIEPLGYSGDDSASTLARLQQIVRAMGGSIQVETNDYFAATFTSQMFGFVDDLEIRIDADRKLVHLRSASRVGYSDRGVNRERYEQIKKLFDAKT